MKPITFSYHAPTTLDAAIDMLTELDDPVVLAGGQSLVPLLNMGYVLATDVVDLGKVSELRYLETGENIKIGAMTTQRDLATSSAVKSQIALLPYAAGFVGQPQTRARGTVGGSVAFGSNVAEIPVALVALQASIVLHGPGGSRTVPVEDFFTDYLTTDAQPDEVLVEVDVPPVDWVTSWGFSELKFRACDFPIIVCATAVSFDEARRIASARIAIGGGGPTVRRLKPLEGELIGLRAEASSVEGIGGKAAELLSPKDDSNAPADYRVAAAAMHIERSIGMAVSCAGDSN